MRLTYALLFCCAFTSCILFDNHVDDNVEKVKVYMMPWDFLGRRLYTKEDVINFSKEDPSLEKEHSPKIYYNRDKNKVVKALISLKEKKDSLISDYDIRVVVKVIYLGETEPEYFLIDKGGVVIYQGKEYLLSGKLAELLNIKSLKFNRKHRKKVKKWSKNPRIGEKP